MDWDYEREARITQRAKERKEKDRCSKFTEVKLEGDNSIQTGFTKRGKKVVFESCFGLSSQSRYGAGTLSVYDGDQRTVIFTKGYPSKALEWMMKN
ncbi:hypothetical protein BK126_26110 [Paenibacillus sp. FSL H7-0326]|uniref:hypothetical protein n=1 Tax=Paenibacillus sp. FSL H7-0326 TaxID=1921144 RepID=UPI00096D8FF8|nr:hypothetical protein [Paenibacillus sp. FSL H7-0326]OMC63671.1 hypothetical protein BK126_26110 [Paenibacillus sp. FSL H7-0326]